MADTDVLKPVTIERLQQVVAEANLQSTVAEDGELGVAFPQAYFWFNVGEAVLRSYAYWQAKFEGAEEIARLKAFANELNGRLLYPKTIAVVNTKEETPTANVVFELCLPITEGLSQAQLIAFIDRVFNGFFTAVSHCEQEFPSQVLYQIQEAK